MNDRLIATITLISAALIFTSFTNAMSGSVYLHKPSGPYGVGIKEYHLINKQACPSVFFKESNKKSFSGHNLLHCNQIKLVVYYPTKNAASSSYHPIPSLITDIKSFSKHVSKSDIKKIQNVRSFSGMNLPIIEKQFPVIFFSPGYGLPAEEYENTLTELVSNGFIVIGVNSQFISGDITFDNAKISKVIDPETEEDKKNLFRSGYKDILYVYEILRHKKITDPVLNRVSWDNVALLGHSLGSALVAHFANQEGIRAVAALDLTIDLLDGNDCHQDVKTPFMHMFSSQMYQQSKSHKFPYLCKANESLAYKHVVIISGDNDPLYSMHMNFCDYSTLQYAPPIMSVLSELKKNPHSAFLGTGNGKEITDVVNQKLIDFFAKYVSD